MATNDKKIIIKSASGGISPNSKTGYPNASRFSRNLAIFEDHDSITLNPSGAKVSGSTVTDLVKWTVDASPFDTNRYFLGDTGNLYKETSGGTWSNIRTVSGSTGQGLEVFDDHLYYAGATQLGRYGKLSGTPAFSDNFLADGSTNIEFDARNSGANTYQPPTSIAETSTAKKSWNAVHDPLDTVSFYLVAKGTGSITVTIHDSNNVTVATATIANGSLTASAYNTVSSFSPTGRLKIGNAYHLHITSTVADSTIRTSTASDLSTGDLVAYFGILITDTYHAMTTFLNGLVICNERYGAFWDQATYEPNKITFPAGYSARTVTRDNEFVVFGCIKGDDSSYTSIERGLLVYWDGVASTFNYTKPVPVGAIGALTSYKNRLLGVYGQRGQIIVGSEPFFTLQEVPQLARGKYVEVYPQGITTYQNRSYIGYSGVTNDATGLENGVYEFGNRTDQDQQPEVLNHFYTPSHGVVNSTSTSIGSIAGFGQSLYVSWKNSSTYGVDKIIMTNGATTNTAGYESLIVDDGNPAKYKQAKRLVIRYDTLPAGCTVTPKYKIDRATSWTSGTAGTVGSINAYIEFTTRFREIEIGFDCASTDGNYPKILEVLFIYDSLSNERDFD